MNTRNAALAVWTCFAGIAVALATAAAPPASAPATGWSVSPDPVRPIRLPTATASPSTSTPARAPSSSSRLSTAPSPATTRTTTSTRTASVPATRAIGSAAASAPADPDDPMRTKVPFNQTLTFPGERRLIVPEVPSRFVLAISDRSTGGNPGYELWDLKTGKKISESLQAPLHSDFVALAPDGRTFAGTAQSVNGGDAFIQLVSLRSGEILWRVSPKLWGLRLIGFSASGNIITLESDPEPPYRSRYTFRNPATGAMEAQTELPLLGDTYAFSNTGQYVASIEKDKDIIRLYDLVTPRERGAISVAHLRRPNIVAPNLFQRLAFSPDGRELLYLDMAQDLNSRLVIVRATAFSATTGEQLRHNVSFIPDPSGLRGLPGSNQSGRLVLSWSPDSSLFLLDMTVFDAKLLKPVLQLPGRDSALARWADLNALLFLSKPADKMTCETVPLDRAFLTKSIANVAAGGALEDVDLPPVTPVNSAAAKTIPFVAPASAPWIVKASDPPAGAPKVVTSLTVKPPPQYNPADSGFSNDGILETSRAANRLFLVQSLIAKKRGTGPGPDPRVGCALTSYDLATGAASAPLLVSGGLHAISASPTGKTLLFNSGANRDRFEVYSGDKSSYKVSAIFRPFPPVIQDMPYSFNDYQASPRWAALLDDSHVLALSNGGTLALFELPGPKLLWKMDYPIVGPEPDYTPVLSVDHKLAALGIKEGVVIFDPSTARMLNALPAVNPVRHLAFSSDGTLLGGIASMPGQRVLAYLVVFELQTGRLKAQIPLQNDPHVAPSFPAPGFVLLGGALISLDKQAEVWSYGSFPYSGSLLLTDRVWYMLSTGRDASVLTALAVPHAEARQAADAFKSEDLYEFCPGMTVKLDISVLGDEDFRKKELARWQKLFTDNGFKLDDNSPRVLRAKCFLLDGPATVYKTNKGDSASVPNRLDGYEITLSVNGRELWKTVRTEYPQSIWSSLPSSVLVFPEPGESFQDAVNRKFPQPKTSSTILAPPFYIPKPHTLMTCDVIPTGFGPAKPLPPAKPPGTP
jgi:WD40 repeat protein